MSTFPASFLFLRNLWIIDDMPRVILRADGDLETGYGHLSRVLAIGEALQDEDFQIELIGEGFEAVLSQFSVSVQSISRSASPKGTVEDATQIVAASPDFVIVDGYDFTRKFFRVLEASKVPFLVIDDSGRTESMGATIVLCQSPSANPSLYAHVRSSTLLLLGPQYCLVRKEFELARELASPKQRDGTFVNFGASDPKSMTERVVDIVTRCGLPAKVALGPGSEKRQERIRKIQDKGVQVSKPMDFAADLATSDLAVIAGGTTIWEAAFLGVPLVAIIVAENQRAPVLAAEKAGLVDWVIDTEIPETRWQLELEHALTTFRDDKAHYVAMAQSRANIVGNLGPRFIASQIAEAIR